MPHYEVVTVHHVQRRSVDASRARNSLDADDSGSDGSNRTRSKKFFGKGESWKGGGRTANLKLHAFGRPLDLNLVRNDGLINKGGLKLWTVHPNNTSEYGVEYVEVPEVRLCLFTINSNM